MAYRWLGVLLLSAACGIGCGDEVGGGPRSDGGTGGGGGEAGDGGSGGTAGGSVPACTTSVLCRVCPSDGFCDTTDDCADGLVCIESGCDSLEGAPIKQCVFAGGGACSSEMPCTDDSRECMAVPEEGMRCVKITPGCVKRFDCVLGFTCEDGECIDRRVPCNQDEHCPKNHTCGGTTDSRFCLRIHSECDTEYDCDGLATHCADIDGDGKTECAGTPNPGQKPPATVCVNADCVADNPSAPVCEVSDVGSTTQCGRYGLCRDENDCAAGFSCAPLWPDGRKECVLSGGCSSFRDCPDVRQVCASPRGGGAPSCQAGLQQ